MRAVCSWPVIATRDNRCCIKVCIAASGDLSTSACFQRKLRANAACLAAKAAAEREQDLEKQVLAEKVQMKEKEAQDAKKELLYLNGMLEDKEQERKHMMLMAMKNHVDRIIF